MYFIVGKTINQSKQVVSYLITDGNGVQGVTPQQVYVEYQKGSLSYLKGFNTNTGEVDFKNIDNTLIPTFYNGRGISNSVSVLKVLEENGKQIGVRVLVASGKILNVSLSDIIKSVNSKKVQLFNAKIVNNKVVMKTTIMKTASMKTASMKTASMKTATNNGDTGVPNGVVNVKDIYGNAFNINNKKLVRCSLVDKKVIIPKGVTSIEEGVFRECEGLTSITIPDSVISIGGIAFADCENLTSINIPHSVRSIGEHAFMGCGSLKRITIPNSVTNIDIGAFSECTGLTSINVDINNTNYCSEGGVLFNKTKTILICYPAGKSGKYIIPNSVKRIGNGAFSNCTRLTSINIPRSVRNIGEAAFMDCTGLTSITIPNSVTKLEWGTFSGCKSLTSVTVPDSVTSIGDHVFDDNTNLCIKGFRDSTVERYAIDNYIKFVGISRWA